MNKEIGHSKSVWPIVGVFLTLITVAISVNIIPPLVTTIADAMAVHYTSFSYIMMFQLLSFCLAGIIGGWICEHGSFNSRTFVLVGLLVVGLTLLVGSTLTRLRWFAVWAIPLGFGAGFVEIFGSILIAHSEKPNSSKLQNLFHVFFCVGAISAPPIVAAMLYLNMPWQHVFILFGLFILLVLYAFFLLTRKGLTNAGHSVQKENNYSTSLLKDSLFILLAATLLIYLVCESLVACWVAAYFEKQLLCSVHSAALRLGVFWGGVIFGRLVILLVPRRLTLWPAMFAGAGVMCLSAIFAWLTLWPLLATVAIFLAGVGAAPIFPTTVAICHSARHRSRFTSYVISTGIFGGVLGAGLGLIIFRYLDLGLFFPSLASGCVILLVLSFLSYRQYCRTRDPEE